MVLWGTLWALMGCICKHSSTKSICTYFQKYIFVFFRLEKRVDRMEKSIGSIVTKIDAVLAKLETMERGKNKRKQKMTEILGTITENDGSESFM